MRPASSSGIAGKLVGELIIDSHGHLGVYPGYWTTASENAGAMVAEMDRLGIEASAISSLGGLMGGDFKQGNDEVIRALESYPGRFIGFANVNPYYGAEIAPELERCWQRGMRGVKIHPDDQYSDIFGKKAEDKGYAPAYEFVDEKRAMLLSHTFGSPRFLDDLARQYKRAIFIIGHGCEVFWSGEAGWEEVVRRHDNVYVSLTTSFRFGHVELLVGRIGSEKLLFGTDATFLDYTFQLGTLLFAKIPDESRREILGMNMRRLLDRYGEDL